MMTETTISAPASAEIPNNDDELRKLSTGELTLITGIAEDITARKAAEERLVFLAHYDNLTGLPNRPLFYDRLQQALAHCRRGDRAAAVVFADLDHFKMVNDTLGHLIGDKVLQSVAQRLQECVRSPDTVVRIGGDEFVVVLQELKRPRDAVITVARLLKAVAQVHRIDHAGDEEEAAAERVDPCRARHPDRTHRENLSWQARGGH